MEFFKRKTHIDFMGRAREAAIFSIVVSLICIGSLVIKGLEFGIDFTGGVLVEVGYEQTADLNAIREKLSAGGFADSQVQNFGTSRDVLIRLPPREEAESGKIGQQILSVLREGGDQVALRRVEFVGPNVGEDLVSNGILAVVFALILIFFYVIFRFQWKFSAGAIVATFHDVLVVIGIFSIFSIPFDLSVLAAVLAVLGYSLNDTIVVFDRIRENFRRIRRGEVIQIFNTAINETLSRTIITHGTTSLVVVALLVFGGETLRGFAIAMMIGIVFGTYSSIYIASATALWLKVSPVELMPPKKTEEADSTP
jgi:preprotein translocase subunit SecF